MRPCDICGFKKIAKTQPEWKKTCGGCYNEGKTQPQRKCEKCGDASINPVSPAWRKLCSTCYTKKQNTKAMPPPRAPLRYK
jgi:formylmethanofuran dehydrogenase subunit E